MSGTRLLTRRIAWEHAKGIRRTLQEFTEISDLAVDMLSLGDAELCLDGLSSISDQTLNSLSWHRGAL